jgi:hypothetical protein
MTPRVRGEMVEPVRGWTAPLVRAGVAGPVRGGTGGRWPCWLCSTTVPVSVNVPAAPAACVRWSSSDPPAVAVPLAVSV